MKVAAIANYPVPRDQSELRSFLGLAQQLGSLIPDLSQATVPLRSLLKSDTEYIGSPEIIEAFTQVKSILTSNLVVHPFDPELETVLITDTSQLHGLGYLLMQYKALPGGSQVDSLYNTGSCVTMIDEKEFWNIPVNIRPQKNVYVPWSTLKGAN